MSRRGQTSATSASHGTGSGGARSGPFSGPSGCAQWGYASPSSMLMRLTSGACASSVTPEPRVLRPNLVKRAIGMFAPGHGLQLRRRAIGGKRYVRSRAYLEDVKSVCSLPDMACNFKGVQSVCSLPGMACNFEDMQSECSLPGMACNFKAVQTVCSLPGTDCFPGGVQSICSLLGMQLRIPWQDVTSWQGADVELPSHFWQGAGDQRPNLSWQGVHVQLPNLSCAVLTTSIQTCPGSVPTTSVPASRGKVLTPRRITGRRGTRGADNPHVRELANLRSILATSRHPALQQPAPLRIEAVSALQSATKAMFQSLTDILRIISELSSSVEKLTKRK
eukprot:6732065-Prorocentrum_lima.AAC.1